MTTNPVRIALLARGSSEPVRAACLELEQFLHGHAGISLLGVVDTDDPQAAIPDDVELAVVLGGDGAILRACRQFGDRQRPILGVNLGRLGFLADLSPDEIRERIWCIERREFQVVHHLMFECEHRRAAGGHETLIGLNEVAILAAASLSMIDIELDIDGQRVTTYSGDGLIVSTPVGSTAHSLSAGGPILRQDLQAFVITPVCPHTLTNRPLVDDAACEYVMRVPDAPPGVMLVVDGQIKQPFEPGDTVIVRRAPVTFQLARIPGHSFYGTLHRKLGWWGQPHYERPRQ
ncbi:MAG: NAD(+)/NADH kinase [Planctomycetaceae bacterium]|nr:NAD(+)/NADH kinase [Planctomycetaceae bacterium]